MSSTVTTSRPNSPTPSPMIDPFGRHISYLRVSVTDRCDFRCVYCMAEDMTFLPKAEVLTLEELERLCSAFVRRGVKKLRLTGGEPLVRKNIMYLFRALGRHLDSGALKELTLTTNGSQLAKYARELYAAGVKRVNVASTRSIPDKFAAITRWGKLDKVLGGLTAAKDAGLAIKINAVALKGVNDDEFERADRLVRRRGLRPDPHRGHADGRDRRRDAARPVSAAVAGARRIAERWTLERDRLSHRRPGPLCRGARRPAGGSASSRR